MRQRTLSIALSFLLAFAAGISGPGFLWPANARTEKHTMKYQGAKTREISFPLGGIGSGSIGLGGNGRLLDWEIFNRPNKNSEFGFSHFAVKAESGGKVLDTRALVGDQAPPYSGFGLGFGSGHSRNSLQGAPHFKDFEFNGQFPIAWINFKDKAFPGRVSLSAFNPFIPMNEKDSSLPGAFFAIELKNTSRETITYTVAGTLKNPHASNSVNGFFTDGPCRGIKLGNPFQDPAKTETKDMTIATDATDVSYQEYWFRGNWFDNYGIYWQDLSRPGKLRNRAYPAPAQAGPATFDDHATLAAHVTLAPGETRTVRFVITWNCPLMDNYWDQPFIQQQKGKNPTWKMYYATLFKDSSASAAYALGQWPRLEEETLRFKNALLSSTLPPVALEAVSANISILKSPTVLRLEDGTFWAFEGSGKDWGSCEGSCSHVWNYQYALPFLFPALERSMHTLHYTHNQRADGKMDFRILLPLSRKPADWHAAADGQLGMVMMVYREWKLSGNEAWLRQVWPYVKRSVEFAWAPTNEDKWDPDKQGVLTGRQHHTLDTELFGPNPALTGFYLGALKAASEMAAALGESAKAEEYSALFRRGQGWVDQNLFNGEYFFHKINIKDKGTLAPFKSADGKFGSVEAAYWDAEHGEIKYQLGAGCHVDQVLAQWHANLMGLGQIYEDAKVKSALNSIYRYNFKKSMRDFFNPCRIFALNDEAALVICDYPKGNKPVVSMPYAEEAMNGFEYQAAIHMIQEGMVKEGLEVVEAVRDRYDGERRNPWNEIECGNNYARSMATYALIPTFSGFQFDMPKRHIGFAPIIEKKPFTCFWSVDGAWGTYTRKGRTITLKVDYGLLTLNSFSDSLVEHARKIQCSAGEVKHEGRKLTFAKPVTLKAGEKLEIKS